MFVPFFQNVKTGTKPVRRLVKELQQQKTEGTERAHSEKRQNRLSSHSVWKTSRARTGYARAYSHGAVWASPSLALSSTNRSPRSLYRASENIHYLSIYFIYSFVFEIQNIK